MATKQEIVVSVVDKTAGALKGISNRIDRLDKGIGGIRRVAGLAASAIGLIGGAGLIRSIVQTTARFQDLRTALSSVTGSARQGADAFDFVSRFSTRTQFGIEELSETFIKLKAAGIEPTEQLLTTFTDTAAVTTDQLGSLQAITDLFARTVSGGLGLEELNRLADRGVPVFRILEEQLGLTRLQVSEFGKTAEGAEKIRTALQQGLDASFGGATAARVNNLSTQMSNLGIAFSNAQDAIGRQGFALALGEVIDQITNAITSNDELVQKIGFNLTKAFLIAVEVAQFLGENIGLVAKAFGILIGIGILRWAITTASVFASVLGPALIYTARMANVAATALLNMVGFGLPGLIGKAAKAVLGIATALGLVKLATDDADEETKSLLDKIKQFGQETFGVEGIEELKQGLADADAKAKELQDKANAFNEEMKNAGPNLQNVNSNMQQLNESMALGTKSAQDLFNEFRKKNEQAQIALELNSVERRLKLAELELEKELTEEQRQRLREEIQSTTNSERRLELQQRINAAAGNLVSLTSAARQEELRIIEQSDQVAKQRLKERLDAGRLNYELYNASIIELEQLKNQQLNALAQQQVDEANRIYQSGLMARMQAVEGHVSNAITEEDKLNLKQIGDAERKKQQAQKVLDFEKKSEAEKTQFALGQASTLFTSLASQNKKFAKAARTAQIAQAIANTYVGATRALSELPPPFSYIAAAATIAAGFAQVQAIRSQPIGYQRGGTMQTGRTALVGEDGPELIVPKQPSTVIPREVADAVDGMRGDNGPVNVNFNITTVDAQSFDDLLIERRSTITNIINNALNKRGRLGVT